MARIALQCLDPPRWPSGPAVRRPPRERQTRDRTPLSQEMGVGGWGGGSRSGRTSDLKTGVLLAHCQAPGVIGSVLGVVGSVAVRCECVRHHLWSAPSVPVWHSYNSPSTIRMILRVQLVQFSKYKSYSSPSTSPTVLQVHLLQFSKYSSYSSPSTTPTVLQVQLLQFSKYNSYSSPSTTPIVLQVQLLQF